MRFKFLSFVLLFLLLFAPFNCALAAESELDTLEATEAPYSKRVVIEGEEYHIPNFDLEEIEKNIRNPEVNESVIKVYQQEYPESKIEFVEKSKVFNYTENYALDLEVNYSVLVDGEEVTEHTEYFPVAPNRYVKSKKMKEFEQIPVTEQSIRQSLEIAKRNLAEKKERESRYVETTEEERAEKIEREVFLRNLARKYFWIPLALILAAIYIRLKKKGSIKSLNIKIPRPKSAKVTIIALVLISSILFSGVASASDHIWRSTRARTGYVSQQMILPYKLSKTVTGYGASRSTPIMIGDNQLYVTDTVNKRIGRIKLDGSNSSTVWRTASGTFEDNPNNGIIYGDYYVLTDQNVLKMFNKNSGSLVRSATMTGNSVNDPLVIGNYLYITTTGGYVYRYTLPNLTGRRQYLAENFANHTISVRCAPTRINDSRIAVVSSAVRLATGNREGHLIVLNQSLGEVGKSRMIAGAIATVNYNPNGQLYVHDYRGHVYRANTSGSLLATRRRPHDGTSGANNYSAQSSGASNSSYYFYPIKTRNSSYTTHTGIYRLPLNFSSSSSIKAYKKGSWPTGSLTISATNYGDTIFYMTNDNYLRAIYASNGSNNTKAFSGGKWAVSVSGIGDFSSPTVNGGVGGYIAIMSSGGVRLFYTDDQSAPTITASPTSRSWGNSNASTSVTVTDKGNSATVGIHQIYVVKNTSSSTPSVSSSTWGSPIYSTNSLVKTRTWTESFSGNGNNYLHVKAVDRVGNVATKTFGPFRVDKSAPSVSASSSSRGWSNSNASTTISISDSHSGIRDVWTIVDQSSSFPADSDSRWSNKGAVSSVSQTFSSNGSNYIHIWARDNAGNINRKTYGPYRVDKNSPSVSANPTSRSWGNTNASTKVTISDAHSGVRDVWTIVDQSSSFPSDSDSRWSNKGSVTSLDQTFSSNGSNYIHVWARDNATNVNRVTFGPFRVDKTNPTVTFDPNSKSWTNQDITVKATASDSGGSGLYRWRYRVSSNDGNSYDSWSNWMTFATTNVKLSTQGKNRIQAEVLDIAGNSKTITSGQYLIDKTPPTGKFEPNSASWTNSSLTVKFTPSDSGGSGVYRWRYRTSSDDGKTYSGWSGYTNGATAGNIVLSAQGTNRIQVEVYDNAGNKTTITSGQYFIDNTLPTGQFSPNSHSWTNGNITVRFTPSDSGGSGVYRWRYRVSTNNGSSYGSWTSYISGATAKDIVLSDQGISKIQAEVYDNAGNKNTITSGSYHIDKTEPNATFDPNSHGWTNGNVKVNIKLTDSGGSGVKRFRIRQSKDNGSNYGSWGSWTTGSTSEVTLSEEGRHKIQVEVEDNAGNSKTVTSGTYNIDKTLPDGSFSPNSTSWTNSSITVKFTPKDSGGSGVYRWRYRTSTDGGSNYGSWSSYINGVTVGDIRLSQQGANRIQAQVYDNAGNVRTITSGIYNIDTTKPSGVFEPNSATWRNSNITVKFTPSDSGGSGVYRWRYRLSSNDGQSYGSWSSYINGSESGNIVVSSEGTNVIQVEVYDVAGNSTTLTSGKYLIDKTKPGGSFSPNSHTWTNQNITVKFTPSDSGGSGVYRWRYRTSSDNGSKYSSWSSYINGATAKDITISPEGTNRIQVEIYDIAGNVATLTSGQYLIDKTLPNIAFSPNGKTDTDNYNVKVTVTDAGGSGVKSVKYQLTDSIQKPTSWKTGSTSFNVAITEQGTFYIHVQAEDNAGNVRHTVSNAYILKNEAPTLFMKHSPNPTMDLVETEVEIEVEDKEDDPMHMRVSIIDPSNNEIPVRNYTGLRSGDKVSFTFIPNKVGQYRVKAVLGDIRPENTRTFYYSINVLLANIEGEVKHTDKWDQNRQHFNIFKSGDPETPRAYNYFFAGERFILQAEVANSFLASEVEVQIKDTPFKTSLINIDGDMWSGSLWDVSMMAWKDKNLEFDFIVTYENGRVAIDTKPVIINSDNYFRIRQSR